MSNVDERAKRLRARVQHGLNRISNDTPSQRALAALVEELGITSEDVELLEGEATHRGFMALDDENPLDRKKQGALNVLSDALSVLLRAAGRL